MIDVKFDAENSWYNGIDADQQKQFRDWMQGVLQQGEMKIKFIKTDGSTRDMLCTLKPELLPESAASATTPRPDNGVQSVWDLEAQAWRSFRYDRLLSFGLDI